MAKIPVKTVKNQDHKAEEQAEQTQEEQEFVQDDAQERPAHEPEEMTTQEGEQTEVEATREADEGVEAVRETEQEAPQEAGEPVEDEDEVSRLRRELTIKEQEAKEHFEARLRLQAEFDNFKKRKEKETAEFRKYANEDFIRELLVVVDDFDRAISAAEQTHKLEDFLKGVEMIFEKFLGVLQKKGVKEIEAKGQPFNPEIHEAMMQVQTDEVEEGTVVEVYQKGYYLHDRVILAPKVAVAKNTDS